MNAPSKTTYSKPAATDLPVTKKGPKKVSKILPFPVKAIKNATNGDGEGKKSRKPAAKRSRKDQRERDELLSKDSSDLNVLSAQIGALDPNLTAIFGSQGFSKFMERMCWRILGVKPGGDEAPEEPKGPRKK